MTAPYPARSEPAALNRPMFLQSFQGIRRAGGLKPAVKTDPRAKYQPIGAYGQSNDVGQWCHGGNLGVAAA